MIQKNSKVIPVDQCGVYLIRIFHLYRGGRRKVSWVGDFVKGSAILTKQDNWIKKKDKLKCVLIRLNKESFRKDGSSVKFKKNSGVLLKKRLTPKGKEIMGPVDFSVKRRKFMNSFSGRI